MSSVATSNKQGLRPGAVKAAGYSGRRFHLADINGLVLVLAVLAVTILSTGWSEVRFQAERPLQIMTDAKIGGPQTTFKLAFCPRIMDWFASTSVR